MEDFSLEDIPFQIQNLEALPGPSEEQNSSESETEEENLENIESKKLKFKRIVSKLSTHIKGLMGEANLRYARGDYELAKKMCFEVIRQAPDAFEPYLTLAQMYENSNVKKYKGFLMLACHLQPSNSDIWCRLAEVELQESEINQAISCYSRAINADPKNMELHLKRIALVQQRGGDKITYVLNCKVKMAKYIPKSQPEQIMQICHDVAKEFFKAKNYPRAIEALRVPIKRIPEKVTQDLLNMMLELLLLSERYSECLDIFTQFCGFTFDVTVEEDMTIIVNSYTILENLHLDLKIKFMVCLIRLRGYNLISNLIDEMLIKDDVEVCGSLYLDLVEALMASDHHKEALKLLIPLVKSQNYSLAAIWLKHAECLSMCKMYEQAVESYFTVISLAPNHVDVLYPLAMLLLKQDKKKEALEVLSQDLSTNKLHVAVLIEQMKLLKQIEDLENYWKCCELLLSRHCVVLKNFEELKVATALSSSIKEKVARIVKFRMFRGQDTETDLALESIFEPTVEEEYKLFREILQFAYDKKDYVQYQKLSFMALTSKRFQKYVDEIYLVSCHACLFNKDYLHGYSMVRELLIHKPHNNMVWSLFAIMMQRAEESRHCYRFLEAHSVRDKLKAENKELVQANYLVAIGNYQEGLSYFVKQYKLNKSTYAAFMMGVCMLQQFCQRQGTKNIKKFLAETVTYLFLNYAKMRSKYAKHEAFYNLGRMYHQLGVFYMAEHYYKKVLKVENEMLDKYPDILGLKQEAAFNLHLIYRSSGNLVAARQVIMQNIVI